jgi:hypothetical protein
MRNLPPPVAPSGELSAGPGAGSGAVGAGSGSGAAGVGVAAALVVAAFFGAAGVG